jgi:hypothetical protein
MTHDKNGVVRGRLIELGEGRIVFLGQCKDASHWHVAFRSAENEDSYWVLSDAAMDALVKLYTDPTKHGTGPRDFPHKLRWVLVPPDFQDQESKS